MNSFDISITMPRRLLDFPSLSRLLIHLYEFPVWKFCWSSSLLETGFFLFFPCPPFLFSSFSSFVTQVTAQIVCHNKPKGLSFVATSGAGCTLTHSGSRPKQPTTALRNTVLPAEEPGCLGRPQSDSNRGTSRSQPEPTLFLFFSLFLFSITKSYKSLKPV